MKLRDSFHPYAAVTIFFWSLAYVLTRLTLQYFTAFSLGFLRYLIASCALIAVAVLTKMKLPSRADLPWFLAAGGIGFFLYMIAFNQGAGYRYSRHRQRCNRLGTRVHRTSGPVYLSGKTVHIPVGGDSG